MSQISTIGLNSSIKYFGVLKNVNIYLFVVFVYFMLSGDEVRI